MFAITEKKDINISVIPASDNIRGCVFCLLFCLIRPPAHQPILHPAAGVTALEHQYAHILTVLNPAMTTR